MQKTSNFTHPYLHKSNNCCTFAAVLKSPMKRRILFFITLCLLGAVSRAEVITTAQNLQSMSDLGTLTFSSYNKVGTTELVTYTCSGTGAEFGLDHVKPAGKKVISIRLPNSGSTVTTSQIKELKEFSILYYPSNVNRTNLIIQLSRDGKTWGDPITGDNIVYSTGSINVTIPRNNYYVRISNNTTSKDASIFCITYYQDHCNCFVYEP